MCTPKKNRRCDTCSCACPSQTFVDGDPKAPRSSDDSAAALEPLTPDSRHESPRRADDPTIGAPARKLAFSGPICIVDIAPRSRRKRARVCPRILVCTFAWGVCPSPRLQVQGPVEAEGLRLLTVPELRELCGSFGLRKSNRRKSDLIALILWHKSQVAVPASSFKFIHVKSVFVFANTALGAQLTYV